MMSRSWLCDLGLCLAVAVGLASAAGPPTSVKLTIPDYEVSGIGELDEVTIPGGQMLDVEEGRPQVPCYVKELEYPEGYRIQEVTMKARSDMKTDSGLKLPVVNFDTAAIEPSKIKEGVYPLEDYSWRTWYNEDGTVALVIVAYPFYYDPKTTRVQFYREYEFEVSYVKTTVGIGPISLDKPYYDPGESVRISLQLENSGKPREVAVAASIHEAITEESVADLPAQTMERLGETDSVLLQWPTQGFSTGDYWVRVVVKDPTGNELGREWASFGLGNPQGEVTDLKVEPEQFKVGDKMQLTLGFKNTGTRDLTGECVFRIMESGGIVDELKQEMALLKPGATRTFKETWGTADAEKGAIYHAVGFVRYEGTASEARSMMFSTNLMPVAGFTYTPEAPVVGEEVEFRASGSSDGDGRIVTYGWRFDDGGAAADSVATHVFQQPGEYGVQLEVIDNEGGIGTVVQTVSVPE
jgi:hypothetical protein